MVVEVAVAVEIRAHDNDQQKKRAKRFLAGRLHRGIRPNGLKLSDGPTQGKTKHERRARAVRWSAWLGSPPTEGLRIAGTEGCHSGGGMMGAAAGEG